MFHFREIDPETIDDATILVDIDGTLMQDGGQQIDPRTLKTLRKLGERNRVYLCSNALDHARGTRIAQQAGVQYVMTNKKKPSLRVVDNILDIAGKRIVIGDKFLTDGIFALRLGADFIKVRRHEGEGSESLPWKTRWIYRIDDAVTLVYGMFRVMRPLQQAKNILIFAPLFFAHMAFTADAFFSALWAVLAFSFIAGSVYTLNDVFDIEHDRKHPRKRTRPLASGIISVRVGIFLAALYAILGFGFAAAFVQEVLVLLAAYMVLNMLYSHTLKHIPVLDILMVSVFYLIRILVGGIAIGVAVSPLLIFTTIFLSLLLITGKRLCEVRGARIRRVAKLYSETFLTTLLSIAATGTLLSYGLYAVFNVEAKVMVYTVLPVMLGIFRYLYVLNMNDHAEFPEILMLKDRIIQVSVVSWFVILLSVFYL